MATVQVGQRVWISARRIGVEASDPSALVERTVLAKNNRTITVDTVAGNTANVATKLVHDHAGISIFRVGDMSSESTLLDPLAKSVLQFCRLLMPDDFVRLYEVRAEAELRAFWDRDHGGFRHIIMIGHGGEQGLKLFGPDDWISPTILREIIFGRATSSKSVISLCCSTGRAAFARPFSSHQRCEAFMAPFGSVHGADASRFTQEFLAYALLDGSSTKTAFNKAETSIGDGRDFRCWKNGKLVKP
ncbi:MAG: hypothetical protein AKCLJLPJ_01035 [Fimbriimonadales bacterium]|nr:hypothetical protein [Fimbriimonadales bacterium]